VYSGAQAWPSPEKASQPGEKVAPQDATHTPPNPKAESKSPAANAGKLIAEHFAVGDKITTKSGKSGVKPLARASERAGPTAHGK
jgi:hypothetical protein